MVEFDARRDSASRAIDVSSFATIAPTRDSLFRAVAGVTLDGAGPGATQLSGAIERIRAASAAGNSPVDLAALRGTFEAAIALILEEHQDWHLLIRPHSLKLG